MTFKSPLWRPVAVVASVLNLVGVGFAAGAAEAWHAGVHAALALAFGLWAERLRKAPGGSEPQVPLEVFEAIEGLESEVSNVRGELSEIQERLDFAERLLAQGSEARRVGPQG